MSAPSSVDRRLVGDLRIVVAPDDRQWQELSANSSLPADFVRHSLDLDERARSHAKDSAVLVVMRVPAPGKGGESLPFCTVPLGLILANGCVYAVSAIESPLLAELRKLDGKAHDWPRHRLILHTLRLTAEAYLRDLTTINRDVDALEDRLRDSLENRAVLSILRYQKSLVYFTTALQTLEDLVERLQKSPTFHVPDEDKSLLEDVLIELRQAREVATVSRDILSEMMDAFASIISNNLNVVMKFFTAFTVVLTIPVTIASFYGMNVPLPFAHSAHSFWIIALFSAALAASLGVYFTKRGWF
jgi:magnesium transporter